MRRSSPSQSRDGGRIVRLTCRIPRRLNNELHSTSLHTESVSVLFPSIGPLSAIAAVLPIMTGKSVLTVRTSPGNRHNRHSLATDGPGIFVSFVYFVDPDSDTFNARNANPADRSGDGRCGSRSNQSPAGESPECRRRRCEPPSVPDQLENGPHS
jgi:hypothetical protein